MIRVKCKFLLLLIAFGLIYFPASAQAQKPLVIGTTVPFFSKALNEGRTLNVYLPEDYVAGDSTTYPVIYIPDGGMEEDFIHLTGIVRFNTQTWIARFPRSIVVGIENTNRKRDFTFAVPNLDFLDKMGFTKDQMPSYGGSDRYIKFLKDELMPYIEANFHGSKESTIVGESLAGLLLTEILVKEKNLFDNYIIVSPSLWWGEERLIAEAKKLSLAESNDTVRVYVGAPQKSEDERMYNDAVQLSNALGGKAKLCVYFDYLPEETHATVFHQAVYNAFKKFYPKTAY
ncbi:MAG: alpha/beta hydrolase [Flavisolibacter sp.]